MSRRRRPDWAQRGAAAVEFALVLPLLLTLVLGTIDWGWYFFVDQLVTNAAREGARAGTLVPPTEGFANAAEARAAARIGAEDYLTRMRLTAGGRRVTPDSYLIDGTTALEIEIVYPVGSMTGFLNGLLPASATAKAVMRWQ